MFGALLLESSAGISLKHTKNHPNFELDRQKQTQNTHSEPFLGRRQTERTKDTSVRKSARPAGVVVREREK